MAPDPETLVGKWLLDRSEPDGGRVYLPYESFAGRPSRAPRPGLEFCADGTYQVLAAGAADGHVARPPGRWLRVPGGEVQLHAPGGKVGTVTRVEGDAGAIKLSGGEG
jgi:hypothetical protein